jgi:predicted CXXCH cytochrome family protein
LAELPHQERLTAEAGTSKRVRRTPNVCLQAFLFLGTHLQHWGARDEMLDPRAKTGGPDRPLRVTSLIVVFFIMFFTRPVESADTGSPVKTCLRIKGILFSCLLMALTPAPIIAARHPVPLSEKTDTAKCIECHADKTKGKFVHSAMTGGCLTCHEVRVTGNITRVKLITGTPLQLCLTCHADKRASDIKGKVHPPAIRGCLVCHDPHSSNYKYHLVKPPDGTTKAENLCLACHAIGEDVPKEGSRHPALDMGCETCHIIHKSGDPANREFAYHLTKDAPALCLGCHDANDAALAKAHRNQPFAKADCIQCHDPHQSAKPMLAQEFLHPPYGSMACETCHAPAKDGKVVLTTPDAKSLCVMCHADQGKEIQTAKVQHPGAQGDCTVCHNPHAGTSPAFLQPNPVAVCLACHSDLAELGKKAHPHQPAFRQGCAVCHGPHGGANAHLLRASDINSLCLACHGPNARPEAVEGTDLVAIFDGKVKLPKNYFRQVPTLPLKDGRGHPTANHPISGVVKLKDKPSVQMNCLSCHQPHASSKPDLLVNDQEPNMAFCDRCHTQGMLISH